ncbi:MAG: hypothetical protein V1740_07035 [Candidatus Woesearchaeota archaeon]
MSEGNIYEQEERELLAEDDILTPEEEAFMKGYDEAEKFELEHEEN